MKDNYLFNIGYLYRGILFCIFLMYKFEVIMVRFIYYLFEK